MANETPVKVVSRVALVLMGHTMILGFSGRTTRHFHYAKHIVWLTATDFDLNRSMRDPEIALQLFGDGAQYILPASDTLLFHRDVAAATNHARANGPNVEIV